MSIKPSQTLSLYKALIKESNKFTSYNFREYAKERVKYEFVKNKSVSDPKELAKLVEKAKKDLDSLKRQVLVSQLYPVNKSVIERS